MRDSRSVGAKALCGECRSCPELSKIYGTRSTFWSIARIEQSNHTHKEYSNEHARAINVLLQPHYGRVSDLLGPTNSLISQHPLSLKRRPSGMQPIKVSKSCSAHASCYSFGRFLTATSRRTYSAVADRRISRTARHEDRRVPAMVPETLAVNVGEHPPPKPLFTSTMNSIFSSFCAEVNTEI